MFDRAIPTHGLAIARATPDETDRTGARWQAALLNVADMLGPVSHELHNVMNNVVLHAALLARDVPESMRQQIAVFKSLAYQASRMLNEVDEYRHHVRSPKQAVDVADAVRRIVESYGQRGILIECQIEDRRLARGNEADVLRLLELLIAAAQAAGPPVSVRVSGREGQGAREGKGEGKVVLRVEDRGSDVDPDKLDQLFEPFAITRAGENALERTACRVIARRLEAKLCAHPRSGGGVAVTVEFQPATA